MKLETITYKDYEIEIHQDEDAESPDSWGNDDCFLVYDHRDFTIKRKGFEPRELWEDGRAFINGYHVFRVNAYIHSGIVLSLGKYPFNDRWDVSTTGYVLVKRGKGWSWTREKASKIAESIITEWNQYLSGEVYGYNSEAGGCCGFYGNEGKKQMIEEAEAEIDSLIKMKQAEIDKLQLKLDLI